ncbi:MAG: hypothetical protein DBX55_05780 [Verrucomicrobia bacterium]|nr:MAG: hypothetical protein DBX55_05780 [Verrucomicrobiota bacterium]
MICAAQKAALLVVLFADFFEVRGRLSENFCRGFKLAFQSRARSFLRLKMGEIGYNNYNEDLSN